MNLKSIMFVGTGSDVGKSVINAGFCRIFKQDGYSPAPFKAQNMSLNSYATPAGFEIGRAQAVQAEACMIDCSVEMNPLLLKPTSNKKSQVVLNGKPIGNQTAKEYFFEQDREMLFTEVMKSFDKLRDQYNPVVIEGAGSISEINLWDKDITNMRVAKYAQASTFLIADIDRGGVFASVYGTMQLLPPDERELIKGIIINKFRGDLDLFEDGKKILEELTGVPVVAIIPYFRDISIDDEDSVALKNKNISLDPAKTNIAVVLLPHLSNFTDFNVLEKIPSVNLYYARSETDILSADIVIIPGSKNTISDLLYLKENGLADAITKAHHNGKSVYGVCGGYQMMGKEISDPDNVEGVIEKVSGLGILPVYTVLTKEKKTEQCAFTFRDDNIECKGYEIHMGTTESHSPVCQIDGKQPDGYFLNNKTWGTYIHGIFDNVPIIKQIVKSAGGDTSFSFDPVEFKNRQYDKLASLIREHTDMDYIYKVLNSN